jgi:hypothetical protein
LQIIFATGDDSAAGDAARLEARVLVKPYGPDEVTAMVAEFAQARRSA